MTIYRPVFTHKQGRHLPRAPTCRCPPNSKMCLIEAFWKTFRGPKIHLRDRRSISSTYTGGFYECTGVNLFINVLRVHFLYKILAPKITKLCFGFETRKKSCRKDFRTKNARVKRWWNRPLDEQPFLAHKLEEERTPFGKFQHTILA